MRVKIAPAVKLLLDIGGVEYPLSKPQLGAQIQLEEDLAAARAEKRSTTKVLRAFIIGRGLPEAVADELDIDQIEAVCEALAPAKKKSPSPSSS